MNATCTDDVIAALRDVQTGLIDAHILSHHDRWELHQMCEWLINGLKESNERFWKSYRVWSAGDPDLADELMDRLFVKLDIQTIDPLSQLLK